MLNLSLPLLYSQHVWNNGKLAYVYIYIFLDTNFGGFAVFYCDITLDVHKRTEAAPFILIAFAQRRNPQGAQAGNQTQDLPNGRQAR